ncbi:glycosyltransferase family protein [Kiloniella antarctica]|uniref:Glycosyltransferase n=1 Tax=Kiloniella antarctica TaxID=1550907 RepID=A0ABW5BPA3_9PROT
MKFLEYMSFYSSYLEELYASKPLLSSTPFQNQMNVLEADAFSGGHLFAPAMKQHGYDNTFAVVNCKQAQNAWARENKIPTELATRNQIICNQIDTIRPDVLHIADPVALDPRLLNECSWKPKLVMAWRAAPIPDDADWSNVDLMISTLGVCREKAMKLGARSVQKFSPAFPEFVAKKIANEIKQWDVVFAGQVGTLHRKRQQLIQHLIGMPEFQSKNRSLRLYLANWTSVTFDDAKSFIKPAVWGMEMFRTLKKGRIVVNNHIDMADNMASNMRIFETLGVGSFLLTEESDELAELFEPGVEVETYSCLSEMEDKIRYYLNHPEKREAIAKRGQVRCFRDHGLVARSQELDLLIKNYLS